MRMTRYLAGEIERWIDDIEQKTLDRCRVVEQYLLQEGRLDSFGRIDCSSERLFAAMFTGDPELLRREHFSPRWVSWIENQRPYAWLSTHEEILVDLVPPDFDERNHRKTFASKYHCSVSQFIQLLENMPDRIRINVRNDSLADYTAPDVIDDMGQILSLSQKFPQCFYKLRPIRNRAFSRLGVSLTEFEEQARHLCSNYAELYSRIPHGQDSRLFALTRVGQYPSERQLIGRVAYYLAARRIWPQQEAGAQDPVIEKWLQPCLKEGTPLVFNFEDLSALTDLVGRLYATHHLFTAQLTGALGGIYGWKPIEFDYAEQIYGRTVPPSLEDGRQQTISTWFFALQAGMVHRPGERGSIELLLPPTRLPNDIEWQSFLSRVNINRHRFREQMGKLSELAGIAGSTRADLDQQDEKAVLEVVERLEKIAKGGFNVNEAATPVIGSLAAGLAAIGAVSCQAAVAIAATAYSIARNVPRLSVHCEKFEKFTSKLCKARTNRTALSGALREFDLPHADVVQLANPKAR
jgi:hypothetical protein